MKLVDLILPERVAIKPAAASKKEALDLLGELLMKTAPATLARSAIFESLAARERLGSTGMGHGIAIPHGRLAELDAPQVAFIRLQDGVDFEAVDHEPVDILVALVVPESATSEHLELLAQLARGLSQPDTIAAIRRAEDAEALYHTLQTAFDHG